MSEACIVCEGYHDRAFWGGLLLSLGCTDPGALPNGERKPVYDPWGRQVRGRQFAFDSARGGFIRVIPAMGKSEVVPTALKRLGEREVRPLPLLVVNMDLDVSVDHQAGQQTGLTPDDLLQQVRRLDPEARLNSYGDIEVDGGRTRVCLVQWGAPDADARGLPDRQTLDRLLCASLLAAYPDRGVPVQAWLDSRPERPAHRSAKEHAWSYLAGWYADCGGYEGFAQRLWGDEQIEAALKDRLSKTGITRIARSLTDLQPELERQG